MEHDIHSVFTGRGNEGVQVGFNSGAIYYSTSTPSAGGNIKPPTPRTNIPFRRDRDFVARGNCLDQIHEKCALSSSRTALVGLGGVGKSQLVIEYGYRVREQCPDTWVFWIFAGSPARFEQDFRKIAKDVQIPGDARNGNWLAIIDNADDDQIFLKSEIASHGSQESGRKGQFSQPLSWFLPQSDNGRVLMTTRYRNIALKFVEERDIIAVEPMDESDALALLEKKIEGLTDRDNERTRKELVVALECMPLAIAQAAAYIFHRALDRPIQKYLEQFWKSDSKRIKLLEREGGNLRRDWEAKNSILITWQISFDHLRRIRQSAADRLSLMSFFDRQGIPKNLIRGRTQAKEAHAHAADTDIDTQGESTRESASESTSESASESSEDDDVEEDMVTLRDYSFVNFSGQKNFEMHALVQLATRSWLANEDKLDAFRRQFFRILARAFPADFPDDANTKRYQLLLPHAKAALLQRPEPEVSSNQAQALRDFALLMHRAGMYALYITMNWSDAESLFKTEMEVWIEILGMNNMDTERNKMYSMLSMKELALTYCSLGQWSEAERLGLEVVAKSKSAFGVKHWYTLRHMSELARIYSDQDEFEKAEVVCIQVLNAMDEMGSSMLQERIASLDALATVYRKQGKSEKAVTIQKLGWGRPKNYMV